MKPVSTTFNEQTQQSATAKKSRPSPFCLRLSREERALLEKAAGDLPLGEYIRRCLFKEAVTQRRRMRKNPDEEKTLLGRGLAELGRSRIPQNIGQLVIASHNSPKLFTKELRIVISTAQGHTRSVRDSLIEAMRCRKGAISNIALFKKAVERLSDPHLAQSLNRIVKAIHIGAFVLSSEESSSILEVCAEIDAIRSMLMKALGLDG